MLPHGSFLVFGPESAPAVHLLSEDEHKQFQARMSIAIKRSTASAYREVYAKTFQQQGAMYALPCSIYECMLSAATSYEGPYKTEVRGIAAAIALGKPFSKDSPQIDPKDLDGGTKVPRKPKPQGKPPSALSQLLTQTG